MKIRIGRKRRGVSRVTNRWVAAVPIPCRAVLRAAYMRGTSDRKIKAYKPHFRARLSLSLSIPFFSMHRIRACALSRPIVHIRKPQCGVDIFTGSIFPLAVFSNLFASLFVKQRKWTGLVSLPTDFTFDGWSDSFVILKAKISKFENTPVYVMQCCREEYKENEDKHFYWTHV